MTLRNDVVFPITVFFENGEITLYESIEDLELNLEDFDSDRSPECTAQDNEGRKIRLKIHLLKLQTLELISDN